VWSEDRAARQTASRTARAIRCVEELTPALRSGRPLPHWVVADRIRHGAAGSSVVGNWCRDSPHCVSVVPAVRGKGAR
jgi:hypothetical protein